jgi:hypothetical protein
MLPDVMFWFELFSVRPLCLCGAQPLVKINQSTELAQREVKLGRRWTPETFAKDHFNDNISPLPIHLLVLIEPERLV